MKLPSWVWGGLSVAALVFGVRVTAGVPGASPPTPPPSASPSPSPSPSAVAPRPVTFDATGTLQLDRRADSRTWTATVFLKNEMECRQTVVLSLSLVKPDGQPIASRLSLGDPVRSDAAPASSASTVVDARSATPVRLGIGFADKEDATASRGYIGISSTVAGPPQDAPAAVATACSEAAERDTKNGTTGVAFREIALLPARPSAGEAAIVRLPVLIAAAIVIVGALAGSIAGKGVKWMAARMRSAEWEESWCSNIALGTGLLNFLVGATVLPAQTRHLPHGSYELLAALFAALATLAPAVYGAIRVAKEVGADGAQQTEDQGFALVFVLASVLTLWGAIGQLFTADAALRELEAGSVLAASAVHVLQYLVWGVGAVIGLYALYSVARFVIEIGQPPETAAARQTSAARAVRAAAAAGGPTPPSGSAPDWRLL